MSPLVPSPCGLGVPESSPPSWLVPEPPYADDQPNACHGLPNRGPTSMRIAAAGARHGARSTCGRCARPPEGQEAEETRQGASAAFGSLFRSAPRTWTKVCGRRWKAAGPKARGATRGIRPVIVSTRVRPPDDGPALGVESSDPWSTGTTASLHGLPTTRPSTTATSSCLPGPAAGHRAVGTSFPIAVPHGRDPLHADMGRRRRLR